MVKALSIHPRLFSCPCNKRSEKFKHFSWKMKIKTQAKWDIDNKIWFNICKLEIASMWNLFFHSYFSLLFFWDNFPCPIFSRLIAINFFLLSFILFSFLNGVVRKKESHEILINFYSRITYCKYWIFFPIFKKKKRVVANHKDTSSS